MQIQDKSLSEKPRVFHVDFLRAIAILGVMVTHALAPFLGPAVINSTWNYLHFVVVAFVFCSGYLTVYTHKHIDNGKGLLAWYKKRFIRLYLPYALYLLIYSFLLFSFPAILAGQRINLNVSYFLDSIALAGGADIGWLTLLFLQLAVLSPILISLASDKKRLQAGLTVCGLFAFITTFARIPASYSRAVAWFPWSLIFLLGAFLAQKEKRINIRARYFFILGLVSFFVWLVLTQILNHLRQPLTLTLHKYPPDLFYFLYGTGINSILLGIAILWKKTGNHRTSIITFLSKYSYGMFFIHLIILEVVTKTVHQANVFETISISIGSTVLLTWIWTLIYKKLNRKVYLQN